MSQEFNFDIDKIANNAISKSDKQRKSSRPTRLKEMVS